MWLPPMEEVVADPHDGAALSSTPPSRLESLMRLPRGVPFLAAVVTVVSLIGPTPAAAAASDGGGHCARQERVRVPGAALQRSACLDDLTTTGLAGTPYTDMADQAGLTAGGTRTPSGVPGIQVDGYFPDSSRFNNTHGWRHDAQFVIRLPDDWNGGLVVTGAPGTRKQYATDKAISDRALAQGYAYAATDKGNSGTDFYRDGVRPHTVTDRPAIAIVAAIRPM